MLYYLLVKWIFYLFTFIVIIGYGDARAIDQQQGLYNSSDYVIVLNYTNLNSTIYHSNSSAYLVEFYSSWCGFCQNFAPIWKSFAKDVNEWNDIVKIGAIDCANDDNNPICRDYEIMAYPSVRYFSPNDKTKGIDVQKGKTVDTLRRELVKKLQDDQQKEKGHSWPNLSPFRNDDLEDAWHAAPETVKYYFFIFDTVNSTLGSEIILDMHKINEIKIRKIMSDNLWLTMMYKINNKFPTLMVMDRKNKQLKLDLPSSSSSTRHEIINVLNNYLQSNGIIIDEKDNKIESKKIINTTNNDNTNIISNEYPENDDVYEADLEYALRYSLKNEIPLKKLIENESMIALKNYIKILSKYYPLNNNYNYLLNIYNDIKQLESISGKTFLDIINSYENKLPKIWNQDKKWIKCKGSQEKYRGYPCGLWTLFHTLTVNHANKNEKLNINEPIEVLSAIHGYVKNFFGCNDCVKHFLLMSNEHKLFDVEYTDDSVLWLWRAHNIVNVRLSGDESEDPSFPKVRYPPREYCEKCRNHDYTWNEDEVLDYLKNKHGYTSIKYYNHTKYESLYNNNNNSKPNIFTWNFTDFDISICVIFYFVSVCIIILVYCKFFGKRYGKKKNYMHTILNRNND